MNVTLRCAFSMFRNRVFTIKSRKDGYQNIALQEIGTPSVCLSDAEGSQTTKGVGLNLAFYGSHDPGMVLGPKTCKIS